LIDLERWNKGIAGNHSKPLLVKGAFLNPVARLFASVGVKEQEKE